MVARQCFLIINEKDIPNGLVYRLEERKGIAKNVRATF